MRRRRFFKGLAAAVALLAIPVKAADTLLAEALKPKVDIWQHIALVQFPSDGPPKVYIDGEEVNESVFGLDVRRGSLWVRVADPTI